MGQALPNASCSSILHKIMRLNSDVGARAEKKRFSVAERQKNDVWSLLQVPVPAVFITGGASRQTQPSTSVGSSGRYSRVCRTLARSPAACGKLRKKTTPTLPPTLVFNVCHVFALALDYLPTRKTTRCCTAPPDCWHTATAVHRPVPCGTAARDHFRTGGH